MSLQTFCRIVRPFGVASSRQFLGRHLPRQAAIQRNIFYAQQKRTSSKDELSALVLGLGLLSTSIVWATKEGAFSIKMTPDEIAKMREQGATEE